MVSLLLILVLLLLWRKEPGEARDGWAVVKSERRILDAGWRGKPDGEMTVGEMERFASDLSDEELWRELEKTCGDWMSANEGRKWFHQPRLAVMLAREVGRRDGEAGMMRVAKWLEYLEGELQFNEESVLREQWQFLEWRVKNAGFAGWVSEDAEGAISRLIESREEEEEWPVVNMSSKNAGWSIGQFWPMEEILRSGFRELADQDDRLASDLMKRGVEAFALNGDPLVESLLVGKSVGDQKLVIQDFLRLDSWNEVLERDKKKAGLSLDEEVSDLVDFGFWLDDFTERLQGEELAGGPLIWNFARARPEEALRVLELGVSDEDIEELVTWLGVHDSRKYPLISEVSDDRKLEVIHSFLEGPQMTDFGPLTGSEKPGAFDLTRLKEVVADTEMSDEVRGEIEEIIQSWSD